MAQYLYRIQPTRLEMLTVGPTPQEEQIVSQHFAYLKNLTEQGVVILVGRTQNNDLRTFGIAISIPALIMYRHFKNKVDTLVVEMEQLAAKLVDIVHGERLDYQQPPRPTA